MQTYKITISFSKAGVYFDYKVKDFEVTTDAVRFTTIKNERYVFDLDVLYELSIGVAK